MNSIGIAFDILETGQVTPIGHRKPSGHMMFDAKMDFTRKARWVLDGNKQASPGASTHAGVVSRESVRIDFTHGALNDVEIWACDAQNAHLQAPTTGKYYVTCGSEFGLET